MSVWVDPELEPSLAALRSVVGESGVGGIADVHERRQVHRDMAARGAAGKSAPANLTITDHEIASAGDGPAVKARLYVPAGSSGPVAAWLYIHGGGLTLGDLDTSHLSAASLAADSGTAVLSVDYRLAPETVFPGALEDCVAALGWLHDRAAEIGVDADRIGVYGVSAGGALAASLALRSRDGNAAPIAKQVLIYPMLDDRPSAAPEAPKATWSSTSNANAWDVYLADVDRNAPPPYAVPARAESLQGLPPTYLEVGSADVLAVGCAEYAARLIADGVPTEFHVDAGAYHAYDVIAAATTPAATARARRLAAMATV